MASLSTQSGEDNQPIRFELGPGETTLGRHPDCTIVIDAGAVSRFHAKVIAGNGGHQVADAGSRNGTFLNGELLEQPTPLKHGDVIRISEVEFVFDGDQTPGFVQDEFSGTSNFDTKQIGGTGAHEMTFDGNQFGVVMLDEADEAEHISKVEFQGGKDGVKMVATPEAKLKALMKINRELGNALALDEVLPNLLTSLFDIFPAADRGFVVLQGLDGSLVPRWVKNRRGNDDETVRISRTIVRKAMEAGSAIMSYDAADDSRFDSSQSIADFSIRSLICAPLLNSEGEALGVLQIDSTRGGGQFRDDDIDLLSGVAAQAGVIINNASAHERVLKQAEVEQDLRLATDVQKAFLPTQSPEANGFVVSSYYQAANHIGGDYYDYIPLAGGRVAVVMADVVGHGVAAAMFMAKLSAETRFCLASEEDPAKAIEMLNDRMSGLHVDRFVTFIVVIIDPADTHVTIVNAGHMPPVFYQAAEKKIVEPGEEESGLPIAIDSGMDYEAVRFPMRPGDLFVIYTDGVNEAMNAADEEFGMERVRELASQGGDAKAVTSRIVDAVRQFVGTAPPFDDMALVTVQRVGTEANAAPVG